jgi:hypothetical protein
MLIGLGVSDKIRNHGIISTTLKMLIVAILLLIFLCIITILYY